MKKIIKSQEGATLIESIIALAAVVAVATGIVAAVIASSSNSSFNQSNNIALNIAQEGSDLVRDQAGSNFTQFKTLPDGYYCLGGEDTALDASANYDPSGTKCNDDNPNVDNPNVDTHGPGPDTQDFLRKIYINKTGFDAKTTPSRKVCTAANSIFIASVVSFTDDKCRSASANSAKLCHKAEVDTCITDLNALPAP